jgi:acetyl esterase
VRAGKWLLLAVLGLGVLFLPFFLSPWPGALLIRQIFNAGAEQATATLQRHVPANVGARLNQQYDPHDPDALLDVYFPEAAQTALTTVVWVHGGGWVSGRRSDIGHYAQILAAQGFTVVTVDYTIAPEAVHPVPARQVNAALGWLAANAQRLRVNPEKFVLAGDSAGAQIASQVALVQRESAYAQALGITPALRPAQVAGLLLYCGAYDLEAINLDGPFGLFLRSVLWSYSGQRDFRAVPGFMLMSVQQQVSANFPPAFISAGNADPLAPQSVAFAQALQGVGVRVDSLFFPTDYQPALGHEYQFDLDTAAGQQALQRSAVFLRSL